jgi:3-oxoacyl-[acyl-carrier protein] reductase
LEIDLSGRRIAVTGGTRGIGAEVVRTLAASGAQVAFQGRDESAALEVIASCVGAHDPTFVAGDLYDYDSVLALFRAAADPTGRLDGVVASGGSRLPRAKPIVDTDPQDLLDYWRTRALHRAIAVRAAAEVMRGTGYGKVVLLSTDAGRVPTPSQAWAGAAAAGVSFLTRAAAYELARYGIRVNTVSVSLTLETPAHDTFLQRQDEEPDEVIARAFAKIERSSVFGLGSTREVADVVAFFQSEATDGISGATLSLNRGGYFPTY